MSVSILICTRNRADVLTATLDSVVQAAAAGPDCAYQLIIIDNNSTDHTAATIQDWLKAGHGPVSVISANESRPGLAAARNAALSHATGDLIVFTDDDCTMTPAYFHEVIASYGDNSVPTIRGGRVELGDPQDLPYTIKTDDEMEVLTLEMNPSGFINGCNMTMNREAFRRIGLFDERFGAGARFRSAEDTDYLYRALIAGVHVEYVPNMTVHHFHGRRHYDAIRKLYAGYHFGNGALYAKYLRSNPSIAKNFYWDMRSGLKALMQRDRPAPKEGMTLAEIFGGNVKGFYAYAAARWAGASTAQRS